MHSQSFVSAVGQEGARTFCLQSKRILTATSQSPCLSFLSFARRLSLRSRRSRPFPPLPFTMASSLPSDLAALERELDSEEFSLMQAPTPSSGLSSTQSICSSARGESFVTPSSARVSSTRNLGGGLTELRSNVRPWYSRPTWIRPRAVWASSAVPQDSALQPRLQAKPTVGSRSTPRISSVPRQGMSILLEGRFRVDLRRDSMRTFPCLAYLRIRLKRSER